MSRGYVRLVLQGFTTSCLDNTQRSLYWSINLGPTIWYPLPWCESKAKQMACWNGAMDCIECIHNERAPAQFTEKKEKMSRRMDSTSAHGYPNKIFPPKISILQALIPKQNGSLWASSCVTSYSWPLFIKNTPSYWCRDSHYKPETANVIWHNCGQFQEVCPVSKCHNCKF